MSLATRIAQEFNDVRNHLPVSTPYNLLQGSLSVSNEVITNGFSTTLYTGNGGTQTVVTNVDMSTQWGNDVSEKFGGLSWFKSRSNAQNNILFDTVRGSNKYLLTDATNAEYTEVGAAYIATPTATGRTIGSGTVLNTNGATYTSWNFQTTHRRTGTTNHGKSFTEHYNPFTGFTIIKYEGSGLAGHEIPHSLGRKLGFVVTKNLSNVNDWVADNYITNQYMLLNLTNAGGTQGSDRINTNEVIGINGSFATMNASSNTYILYGWANSYYDENNTLIGNYEIGVYQGTGATGNKVTTKGKPAWVMVKRLDAIGNWVIVDNKRGNGDYILLANTADVEDTIYDYFTFLNDGFTNNSNASGLNASGSQYLYMAVYDNDNGSGKSKYPKATDSSQLQINALVPYANGIDVNGSKVSISYKNETITGLTYTQGKNYPYSKNDGTYGSKAYQPQYGITNPLTGDFFNLKTLKWYDNTNAEITPRTYLDCVAYADHNGQLQYVEELPKTTYFDKIKANEYKGKNACTAWVNFDGTTTPPTIRDSYNVASVVRIAVGSYEIYFKKMMDNTNYNPVYSTARMVNWADGGISVSTIALNKVGVYIIENNTSYNSSTITVNIFGGKNV